MTRRYERERVGGERERGGRERGREGGERGGERGAKRERKRDQGPRL